MKNSRNASRPTSIDVAYRAGVSQSTVSRALRDSPVVSPETRRKVQRIARECNYRVDKNASALRSQTTRTLALLMFEDPTADESPIDPFFLSMLGCITRAASARGYDLLASFQQAEQDWHIEYVFSARADGLILLGYGDSALFRSRLASLADAGARFALWGPDNAGPPGVVAGIAAIKPHRRARIEVTGRIAEAPQAEPDMKTLHQDASRSSEWLVDSLIALIDGPDHADPPPARPASR